MTSLLRFNAPGFVRVKDDNVRGCARFQCPSVQAPEPRRHDAEIADHVAERHFPGPYERHHQRQRQLTANEPEGGARE